MYTIAKGGYCIKINDYAVIVIKLDESEGDLIDYKFMCFNGKVQCIFTCTERYSEDGLKVTFFDTDWNVLPFERTFPKSKKNISKPRRLVEMISISEKLSCNIPFVRVDLYECNNRIFFGEMTFFPGNGFERFNPQEWDNKLGSMISLSGVNNEY